METRDVSLWSSSDLELRAAKPLGSRETLGRPQRSNLAPAFFASTFPPQSSLYAPTEDEGIIIICNLNPRRSSGVASLTRNIA